MCQSENAQKLSLWLEKSASHAIFSAAWNHRERVDAEVSFLLTPSELQQHCSFNCVPSRIIKTCSFFTVTRPKKALKIEVNNSYRYPDFCWLPPNPVCRGKGSRFVSLQMLLDSKSSWNTGFTSNIKHNSVPFSSPWSPFSLNQICRIINGIQLFLLALFSALTCQNTCTFL